ncbi:hypothetical protein ACI8AV_13085 [Geodermatophilus sp. SYSU D00804]
MTLCIPEAIGVPGLIGQPPTWPGIDVLNGHAAWPTASPSITTPLGLDDPRWQGHLGIGYPAIEPSPVGCCGGVASTSPTFGTSTAEDALVRMLHVREGDDPHLYLSWWVKADDGVDHSEDALFIGFGRRSGDPMVVRVTPFASNTGKLAEPAAAFTVWTTPASGAAAGTVRNWDENEGANPSWLDVNTRVWLDVPSNRWAVQMRVPIGSGDVDTHLDLDATFRMWFEISIELPGDLLAPYSWPRNSCVADFCGLPSVLHVPSPAVWDTFHLSSGPGDPECPTTGFVRLDRSDVGTQNTPTSRINLVSDNVFEARPENRTGATVDPGEISAEFRIANWGSVAHPSAPWTLIPATGGTTNPADNPGSIPDGAKGSITMRWQLNPEEAADYGAGGTKSRHQCILVTLTGAHVFNPASVWRNMDFVSASRFARTASISNVGLGPSPVPGTPRPTYVLVERLNMPPVLDREPPRQSPVTPQRRTHPLEDVDLPLLQRAADALTDPNDRAELQPTIRYHTFHDTGVDVTRDGTTYRLLRPGTAFGYHVEHEGPLTGWREQLQGATRVSEALYRFEVPEEGSVTLITVVEAVERGGCLGLLGLVGRLLRRLRP